MKEKKRSRNASLLSHPGIEVLEDGIKTTGSVRGGRKCVCSPGGWEYGRDDCGCACGCPYVDNDEANNHANFDRANPTQ